MKMKTKIDYGKIILIIILMIHSVINVLGQKDNIPVKKLHKDVKFFFSTIKKVHPNPYAFADAKILDSIEKKSYMKLINLCHSFLFPE
jgi:hypothetical protein